MLPPSSRFSSTEWISLRLPSSAATFRPSSLDRGHTTVGPGLPSTARHHLIDHPSGRQTSIFGLTSGPKLTAMRRSQSIQHRKVEQARAVVAQALGDAARRFGESRLGS